MNKDAREIIAGEFPLDWSRSTRLQKTDQIIAGLAAKGFKIIARLPTDEMATKGYDAFCTSQTGELEVFQAMWDAAS